MVGSVDEHSSNGDTSGGGEALAAIRAMRADPAPDPERLNAALRSVQQLRSELDRAERALIAAARATEMTWPQVALALGKRSPQAAEQRYKRLTAAGPGTEPAPVTPAEAVTPSADTTEQDPLEQGPLEQDPLEQDSVQHDLGRTPPPARAQEPTPTRHPVPATSPRHDVPVAPSAPTAPRPTRKRVTASDFADDDVYDLVRAENGSWAVTEYDKRIGIVARARGRTGTISRWAPYTASLLPIGTTTYPTRGEAAFAVLRRHDETRPKRRRRSTKR